MNITMIINFFPALISAIFIGGVAGYLGSLMLSKKMTIVVDPLSHLALPGVALALIFQKDISLGAFLFLFFGTILIWFLENKTKISTETIIAILFSASLAFTFLFLSDDEIETALMGDISKIGFWEAIFIILLSISLIFLIKKIYPKILLISISEDLARGEKINLKKYQFLYLISISLIVSLGVKFVGGLLVAGLTALPSATSANLTKNLKLYKLFSIIFGSIAGFFGIIFSKIFALPAGSLIIIISTLFFIFSVIFKK